MVTLHKITARTKWSAASLTIALIPLSLAGAQALPSPPTASAVSTTQPALSTLAVPAESSESTDFRQKLRDAFADLDLSPDQKLTLAGIFQNARERAEQLRQDHAQDSPLEQRMRRRRFLQDLRSQSDAVLTPEQRAKVAPAWQSIAPAPAGVVAAPTSGPTGPGVSAAVAASTPPSSASPPPSPAKPQLALPLPTTGPANPSRSSNPTVVATPPPRPGSRVLPRLQAALATLTLTGAQHQQIDALLGETRQQFAGLDAGDRAAKARQVPQSFRVKLRDILTPDQLVQLRDSMRSADLAESTSVGKPADAPADATAKTAADTPSQQAEPQLIARGSPAPPFTLFNSDDDRVTLSQFHGRVLVLIFGSYTSPTFRDRAAGLQKLWRTNDADDKATLFIIYTREAHPTNGWQVERNKTDHVLLAQTDTVGARRAAALECRSALHLSVPMLLDSLDDATATAYGAFPDGAVVIDRTGTVAASLHWAEPTALQRAIDEATKQVATTRP